MASKKGVLFWLIKKDTFLGSFLGPFRVLLGAPGGLIFGSRGAQVPKRGSASPPSGTARSFHEGCYELFFVISTVSVRSIKNAFSGYYFGQ